MKRSRDRSAVVSELKKLLVEKGPGIVESERSRIPDRSMNTESVEKYVRDQTVVDGFDGKVLDTLIRSVTHVSSIQLFRDIERMSTSLWEKLREFKDRRFYLFLGGGNDREDTGGGCFYKSNMFVGVMLMAFNADLASNLVDFICDAETMYTNLDDTVQHYLYADDASFSGNQVVENLEDIGAILEFEEDGEEEEEEEEEEDEDEEEDEEEDEDEEEEEEYDTDATVSDDGRTSRKVSPERYVHVVLLYANPNTISHINESIDSTPDSSLKNVHWYTSPTHQRPVKEYVHDFIVRNPGTDFNLLVSRCKRFLRGKGYTGKDLLNKPLFYTDIKIADEVSIYPMFLLKPIVLRGKRDEDFSGTIVNGCPNPKSPYDEAKIVQGNFCPFPVYKDGEWMDFVKGSMDTD